MSVVDAVKADPSLRHRPLVCAADPGGPCAHAAGRRVPIPGEPLGKRAVRRAARLLPRWALRVDRSLRAHGAVLLGFPLAVVVVVRGRRLAQAARMVMVGGAAVGARPVPAQVRVAALLGSAPVGLRLLEADREVDNEAGGPGTAGPPVTVPLCAVFCVRRGKRVFLYATRSCSHFYNKKGDALTSKQHLIRQISGSCRQIQTVTERRSFTKRAAVSRGPICGLSLPLLATFSCVFDVPVVACCSGNKAFSFPLSAG